VDDVWGCAAVGDVHADDVVWAQLLTEDTHGVIRDDEGIEGVDAEPGAVCGVSSFSEVRYFEAREGCGTDKRAVVE
jgi:hypothetical protein